MPDNQQQGDIEPLLRQSTDLNARENLVVEPNDGPAQGPVSLLFSTHVRLTALIWAFSPLLFAILLKFTFNHDVSAATIPTSIAVSSFWFWIIGLVLVLPFIYRVAESTTADPAPSLRKARILAGLPWLGLLGVIAASIWLALQPNFNIFDPASGLAELITFPIVFLLSLATISSIIFGSFSSPAFTLSALIAAFYNGTSPDSSTHSSPKGLGATLTAFTYFGFFLLLTLPVATIVLLLRDDISQPQHVECAIWESWVFLTYSLLASSILLGHAKSVRVFRYLALYPWIGAVTVGFFVYLIVRIFNSFSTAPFEYCSTFFSLSFFKYPVPLLALFIVGPFQQFCRTINTEVEAAKEAAGSVSAFVASKITLSLRQALTWPIDLLAWAFLIITPFGGYIIGVWNAGMELASPYDCVMFGAFSLDALLVFLTPLYIRRSSTTYGTLLALLLFPWVLFVFRWVLGAVAPHRTDNNYESCVTGWSVFSVICGIVWIIELVQTLRR
ncbi:hypothetical protein BJ742DRAFT_744815 [Cladochytrium replicatum]|nr:hypothetical protein BJ742DRAFT_744815 [Cladochytrium replicatum]